MRYFYAFVVALLLFTLGAVFAIYEGVHKVIDPHPLEAPLVAVIILVLAVGLEGFSFRTAIRESGITKGDVSWCAFIREAKIARPAGGAAGGHRRADRPDVRAARRRRCPS